jgi:hypothetical protein
MGLQAVYDLEEAQHKLGNRLIDEVSNHAAWAMIRYAQINVSIYVP